MNQRMKFAGNDYLGMATNPEVVEALRRAALEYGISATSSRWAVGWTDVHARLEREVADFLGTEDAILLGATYIGGPVYYGVMKELLGDPVVFLDETAHTTHKLGTHAYALEVRTFRHLDVSDLARQLAEYDGRKPIMISSDGVFSISGEVSPAAELAGLAKKHNAALLLDEAHGFGVLGEIGRGAFELAGVDPAELTVLVSLSKAIGCGGGMVAGRKEFIDRCRRCSDANASSHTPPPVAAAAVKALEVIRTQPQHRERMEANARFMRQVLADAGIGVVDDRHPIVAMLFADEAEASAMSERFAEFGLWIPYFKYPSEPRHNMLRSVARAVYTEEHLDRFAEAVRTRPRGS